MRAYFLQPCCCKRDHYDINFWAGKRRSRCACNVPQRGQGVRGRTTTSLASPSRLEQGGNYKKNTTFGLGWLHIALIEWSARFKLFFDWASPPVRSTDIMRQAIVSHAVKPHQKWFAPVSLLLLISLLNSSMSHCRHCRRISAMVSWGRGWNSIVWRLQLIWQWCEY